MRGSVAGPIEPSLKKDRGRACVDPRAAAARVAPTFSQPPGRLHRRQPLVDQFDLTARCVGQSLGELASANGFAALIALAVERQSDEETLDPLASGKLGQLAEQLLTVAAGKSAAWMGQHAKLVRHRYP